MRGMQEQAQTRRKILCLALLGAALGFGLSGAGGSASGRPEIGSALPSLLAEARMRNAPVGVAAPQGGWVIYAFSPMSPASEKNHPSVEKLARALPPGWQFLAVATEPQRAQDFIERLHVTIPVLTQVAEKALEGYRITSTPRTYLLDKDWKLLEILDGPYEGEVAKKLSARFKVTLPAGAEAGRGQLPGTGPANGARNLCLDRQQYGYSRGAKAEVLGWKFQCGPGGVWVPVAGAAEDPQRKGA
jgi:hypothetical protein